jgi:hypothetical protein
LPRPLKKQRPSSLKEIPLASWADFETEIQRIAAEQRDRETKSGRQFGKVLFRGMANAKWGLETTLERSYPSERCDATNSFLSYYLKVSSAQPAIETFSGKRLDSHVSKIQGVVNAE